MACILIGKRFRQKLLFAAAAFLVSWSCTIFALGMLYTERLLRPGCQAGDAVPEEFQPVELVTKTGLRLDGWWRAPDHQVAVMILGGLGASRESMLPTAEILAKHGYGVLTIDYRHCAGRISTLGYREVEELQAMLDFALQQPQVENIAVYGFSVGGAAALLGAAQDPRVEAVIAEGNYANLKDEISASPAAPLSLQWQIQLAVRLAYWLRTGIPTSRVSPIDAISQIAPRPILLIHGEQEIERTRGRLQFAAAQNASLWVAPGAGHGQAILVQPEEYERRITTFLQDSFPGED